MAQQDNTSEETDALSNVSEFINRMLHECNSKLASDNELETDNEIDINETIKEESNQSFSELMTESTTPVDTRIIIPISSPQQQAIQIQDDAKEFESTQPQCM